MQYVVDASTVINLVNVNALRLLRNLSGHRFWITHAVFAECRVSCGLDLVAEILTDGLSVVEDTSIDAPRFLELLDTHSLGEGETESIVACEGLSWRLCCDDKKARKLGQDLLGADQVTGSIGILRMMVIESLISRETGMSMYKEMKTQGGFLPNIRIEDLDP